MSGRRKMLFAAVACAIALACVFLRPAARRLLKREEPVIALHDGQSDSLHLNNAVAAYIIEEGYGYRVRTVMQTTHVMQTAMQKNRIDVNLEARRQEWPRWFNEQVRAGRVLSLGVIFEGSSQFFVVPKWVAEKYGIETIFDMRERWQVFKDPDSPSKGVFYNGPIGSGCDRINAVKLQAYGLAAYYNVVSPQSAAALEAILARHQEKREPVFGFCWAPNAVMGAYEWHVLKEPAYSDECWEMVMDALEGEHARPPDRACSYKTIPMEKIISRGLLTKAPDAVEMLKKMRVKQETMNEIFAWMRRYNVKDWRKPALYFLREHDAEWKDWVTAEAYGRVVAALQRAPGAASAGRPAAGGSGADHPNRSGRNERRPLKHYPRLSCFPAKMFGNCSSATLWRRIKRSGNGLSRRSPTKAEVPELQLWLPACQAAGRRPQAAL